MNAIMSSLVSSEPCFRLMELHATENRSMSVMLTEKAASEVKRTMSEFNCEDGTVLRIAVLGGGCSGFEYGLNFDTSFDAGADSKSEQHGVTVVVDKKSAMFLEGT